MSRQTSLSKTVDNGEGGFPLKPSQKLSRRVRNRLPNSFALVNQQVVVELVDEEPTEEMILARKLFWEKVFAELLPAEEERSVKSEAKEVISRAGTGPRRRITGMRTTDNQLAHVMKIESSRKQPKDVEQDLGEEI